MIKSVYRKLSMTLALTLFLSVIMLASLMILGGLGYLLSLSGIFDYSNIDNDHRYVAVLSTLLINFLIATVLTAIFSKRALKRFREFVKATEQVAQGNFYVRMEENKGIGELSGLESSFNKMTQELASIEILRSDFVNNLSHEFKTPIVSIKGFAKLLMNENLSDAERREYLEVIISESERLAALSTNALNLSKCESLEIVTEKEQFRLDEQIRRAIVLTEAAWSAKSLDIDVEMEEVVFYGNADLTQQIWLNLIDNAIKFSDRNGILTIRLTNEGDGLRFAINDTGIGMDEETIAHIFKKFYQADISRSESGNGLGLAIVERIVELCKGRIGVQSIPDEGSEFTVWLPLKV